MIVRDVVEEETPSPAEEGSIYSGYRSTEERPLLASVVRNARVGMVEICQHDDPVVSELRGRRRRRKRSREKKRLKNRRLVSSEIERTVSETGTHQVGYKVELHEVSQSDLFCPQVENTRHDAESDV